MPKPARAMKAWACYTPSGECCEHSVRIGKNSSIYAMTSCHYTWPAMMRDGYTCRRVLIVEAAAKKGKR